jgi:hypothetical protein
MGGDLLFDNGACSGFEHLMPLSGGMVEVLLVNGEPRARHKFTRGALVPRDGAEIFSRGADPSSEARMGSRVAWALNRGGELAHG